MKKENVKKLTTLAMFAAISIVLVTLVHFPLFPAMNVLEYDPADIPIFIATFLFGPGAGMLLTVVVSVIQGMTVSASGQFIGICMHIVATGSYVLSAGFFYKRKHSTSRLILSGIVGVVVWVVMMLLWNLLLTPIFYGMPVEAVIPLLLPVILPFNLIKAGGNTILAIGLFLLLFNRGVLKRFYQNNLEA
jgi:riboflavin transporter FmnP